MSRLKTNNRNTTILVYNPGSLCLQHPAVVSDPKSHVSAKMCTTL